MNLRYLSLGLAFLSLSSLATPVEQLITKAELVFQDDFNRSETDDNKEQLGKGWKTNSKNRAQGVKQADLKDGALYIKMAKEANHGVSVLHTAPFDDGVVKVKFNIQTKKGTKFNFNDPKAKHIAHAGHVCSVAIRPNGITIQDQLDGIFRHDINKMRKSKDQTIKAKAAEMLKGRQVTFKGDYKLNHWYDLAMVFKGDTLQVYVDDKKIGELSSKGIDHKVKDNIAFAVTSEVIIDDLKIWSLD